jgi:hypothetical protein
MRKSAKERKQMNKMNNILGWDYFYIYLSGHLDAARESGREWRAKWVEKLVEMGFEKRQIFNPCQKPLEGAPFNLDNEGKLIDEYRKTGQYNELCQMVKQIAHIDLRLVDLSSLILVNFPVKGREYFKEITEKFERIYKEYITWCPSLQVDEYVEQMKNIFYELLTQSALDHIPTVGTYHEIVEARRQKKPVFVVYEGGKQNCSGWLMWLVGHNNVFGTFEEMAVKLSAISQGREEIDAEDWLLLNLDKQKN